MKHDFITQFFYGNITPNARNMPKNSDLGKATRAFADAKEQLLATLTETEKSTLECLLNAHTEILVITDHDSFCQGFRLGAMMMLDVLDGDENAL